MGNQYNYKSFKDFCIEHDRQDVIDLWDYEMTGFGPEEVGCSSTKKAYLKCSRGLHPSSCFRIDVLFKSIKKNSKSYLCRYCHSIKQYIIDNYSEEYFNKIWSEKNEKNAEYDISCSSGKKIWLKCQVKGSGHPDYDLKACSFKLTHNCPYCSGDRACYTNSLGYKYPKAVKVWSEKNEKSVYEYTSGSKSVAWFKCPNGFHEDHQTQIQTAVKVDFRCPKCSIFFFPKGEEHGNWREGGTEGEHVRNSSAYKKWRSAVLEKDGNLCQCCGISDVTMNAHHIYDFAMHKDKRLDVRYGICLCKFCHDSAEVGSLHNVYGTHGVDKYDLEEYINERRKELGLNIPFSIDEYMNGNILTQEMLDEIVAFYKEWKFVPYNYGTKEYVPIGIAPQKAKKNFVQIKPKYRVKED